MQLTDSVAKRRNKVLRVCEVRHKERAAASAAALFFFPPKSWLLLSATQAPARIPCGKLCMLDVALLRFHRAPRSLAKGHRAPSQKGIARTRGRKSWQLTVAYNGFPALESLRLPAAWQGINSCFFRHARCRRNIGNIGTPLHLWFRIITQSEIFLNHMYWNQRQKLCN